MTVSLRESDAQQQLLTVNSREAVQRFETGYSSTFSPSCVVR